MAASITDVLYDWMHGRRILRLVADEMGVKESTLYAELGRRNQDLEVLSPEDLIAGRVIIYEFQVQRLDIDGPAADVEIFPGDAQIGPDGGTRIEQHVGLCGTREERAKQRVTGFAGLFGAGIGAAGIVAAAPGDGIIGLAIVVPELVEGTVFLNFLYARMLDVHVQVGRIAVSATGRFGRNGIYAQVNDADILLVGEEPSFVHHIEVDGLVVV